MKTKELYNSIASEYEELISSPQVNARLLEDVQKIFSKHDLFAGSILDVGCGPGNLKSILGDGFSYTGIDCAEKMLEIAEGRGYGVILGNIEDEISKIPNKSFDYIVSISALYFVSDVQKMLSEFERIARKGYLITLADLTQNYIDKFPVEERLCNHSRVEILNTAEDIWTKPWISIKTGDEIRERMVLKLF